MVLVRILGGCVSQQKPPQEWFMQRACVEEHHLLFVPLPPYFFQASLFILLPSNRGGMGSGSQG